MSFWFIFFIVVFMINLLLIGTMIFVERKKPERIAVWCIIIITLPIVGFMLYLLVGGGLSIKTKRMLKKKALYNDNYMGYVQKQMDHLYNEETRFLDADSEEYKELIMLNLKNNNSVYSRDNIIEFFHSGKSFCNSLKQDLLNAKVSINLLFYIFANDKIGKEIANILALKASEGVKVKLLFDSVGSLHTGKKIFKNLLDNGGKVAEFFPPFMGIKLINLKANYRNHRKIVVVDGKIGYVGGINIRDDHMSEKPRLSPWRDETIRIEGSAVYSLQNTFFSDWRNAINDLSRPTKYLTEKNFPVFEKKQGVGIQIISSGPEKATQQIKQNMIKMINMAKKSIKIQTPYFIPDDSFLEALNLAMLSGVSVELMLPKLADKKLVHNATLSYACDLMKLGAKVFVYDGFLHSKTMIIDDKIFTVGSCNIDIRSFGLNFETNAVVYNARASRHYANVFAKDKQKCEELLKDYYDKLPALKKLRLNYCRLFTPLL